MNLARLFRRETAPPPERTELFLQVQAVMDEVRVYAQSHGGDIELVEVTPEGEVRLKMHGACRGCPMSAVTIKIGVEANLRKLVPGVTKVRAI